LRPSSGELTVQIEGPLGTMRLPATPAFDSELPSDEPQPVGLFTVSDELLIAGRYKLSAALLGEEIVGSPIEIVIIPAAPDGDHCLLVPPPAAAIAHEPVTFVVQPRDRFDSMPPPHARDGL
jgi:hypothetical protein